MKIVFVHYHLRTGGVTRVMDDAAQVLTRLGHEVAIVAGEEPDESALRHPVRTGVVPSLAYGLHPNVTPNTLVREVRQVTAELLNGAPDLWHIHNHALGKNNTLPLLVDALAQDGERLVLQPHDFAEDGRPTNYAFLKKQVAPFWGGALDRLYPQADSITYAVLNDRDAGVLRTAGFQRVLMLPNPVDATTAGDNSSAPTAVPRRWVYPTRAIRRKNIGEFLLLSLLNHEGDVFSVTRAPQNPAERPGYEEWVRFAAENRLNIEWEYGRAFSSSQAIVQSAHAVVTTSVAEGFGLVYLEPWLADRPLTGRNLPLITRSLCESGLDLASLYEQLNIPLEWIGRDRLREAIEQSCRRSAEALGESPDPDWPEQILESMTRRDVVDFGRLNETLQREVLCRLIASPEERVMLAAQIPPLAEKSMVAHNRRVIATQYNPERYGERLLAIYQHAGEKAGPLRWSVAQTLLDCFHQPDLFNLLRAS